jgi:HEAT repeat protein
MTVFGTPEAIVTALSGSEGRQTWHSLVECRPDLRVVSGAYSIASTEVRVLLLQALREWRTQECLPLARIGLDSSEAKVWKEALDVLVTIGNQAAAEELRQSLTYCSGEKQEWIQEALQQVSDPNAGPG